MACFQWLSVIKCHDIVLRRLMLSYQQ